MELTAEKRQQLREKIKQAKGRYATTPARPQFADEIDIEHLRSLARGEEEPFKGFGGGESSGRGVGISWGGENEGVPMAQSTENPMPTEVKESGKGFWQRFGEQLSPVSSEGELQFPPAVETFSERVSSIPQAAIGAGIKSVMPIEGQASTLPMPVPSYIPEAVGKMLAPETTLGQILTGGVDVQPKDVLDQTGARLETILNIATLGKGKAVTGAGKQILKESPTLFKYFTGLLKQPAKVGAIGGTYGVLGKAQESEKPMAERIKEMPAEFVKNALIASLVAPAAGKTIEKFPSVVDKTMSAGKQAFKAGKTLVEDLRATKASNVQMSQQAKIPSIVEKGMEKGIRPTVVGKGTAGQIENYKAKAQTAVKTIVDNKPNLQYTTPEGEIVAGELPKNLNQFTDAIDQTKKTIFQKYDTMAKESGEAGVIVDLKPVVKELRDFANSPDSAIIQDKHPQVIDYANRLADTLEKRGQYTPSQVQDAIAMFNQDLKAFYKNPQPGGFAQSGVDAMVANKLRSTLDDAVSNSDIRYQDLKNQYGALSAIEKDVAHRATVANRAAPVGLSQQLANIGTAFELVKAFTKMDPASLASAGAIKGVSMWNKYLNDPNVIIRKMFEKVEEAQSASLRSSQKANAMPIIKTTEPIINPNSTPKTVPSKGLKGKGEIPQTRITDLNNFKREPNLSPSNKKVEQNAFRKILEQEDQILSDYKAKHGNYVSGDAFRPYFKDVGYIGTNAAAVQEPISYLNKRAFSDGLNNEGRLVIGTGGGSGAGKSTALENVNSFREAKNEAAMIYDSNLSSYDSLVKKAMESRNAGKEFVEYYVYRDPLDAFENGVIKRMLTNEEEAGRLVPSHITAKNHIGSWDAAKRFEDNGGKVFYVDNSLGKNGARLTTRAALEAKIKYPSTKELTAKFNKIAKRLYEEEKITKAQYEGYLGE